MNSLAVFLSPVALLLPAFAADLPHASPAPETAHDASVPAREAPVAASEALGLLDAARQVPVQHQVRIEQRVIIRIAPSSPAVRERMLSALSRRSSQTAYEEQRLRGCIAMDGIVGVQPAQENRLLLFMRDRRVLTAALDRACKAEDFYSGFYVERSEDGQLCSRRDELQSRAGASCRIAQLNRLVAVRD
jgi:hypothetical protein